MTDIKVRMAILDLGRRFELDLYYYDQKGKLYTAELIWKRRDIENNVDEAVPRTLVLGGERMSENTKLNAQSIIDGLWSELNRLGLKTSYDQEIVGEVRAMKEHLKDAKSNQEGLKTILHRTLALLEKKEEK